MGISDRFVFQHDLDLKHTAPAFRQFFEENNIEVMKDPERVGLSRKSRTGQLKN
jgi:hypothetical protein